ncbi:hypothetical protein Bca4012_063633 [Brassica carinata]
MGEDSVRIEEKLNKGNVNESGRHSIIDKFYEAYGERHLWRKFGIKHTTCKTQYAKFKRLIHKRTGFGYDPSGFIDMSDDWWNEIFKVQSAILCCLVMIYLFVSVCNFLNVNSYIGFSEMVSSEKA